MIEVRNLTKKYGQKPALEGFNLTIPSGSIFGLIGVNGAGKSTFLRLLSGVFRPDEGEILIDGQPVYENEKVKKDILFLPDELLYSPGLNGKRLKELYKTFYPFDDSIFKNYLDIFKLDPSAPLRSFSKGMRRQMFVCIAFASQPKYWFLDEVFDGLDPNARLVFKRGLIESVTRTGGTAVLASHSLRELEDISDEFGLIDGKKILNSGDISKALETVCKFQIAFDRTVTEADLGFNCMSFEASGRVIKIVVKGDKTEYLKKINTLNPLIIDEITVDLEEFFLSEIQGAEKENRDI